MTKWPPNALVLFFFPVAFVCFYYFSVPIFFFPDAGWHVAAGALLQEISVFDLTNYWSHTAPDHPWLNISWLHNWLLDALQHNLGLESLLFYIALLSAGALTVTFMHCLDRGVRLETAAVICFLVGFAMLYNLSIRPQMIGFLFTSLVFFLVYKYELKKITFSALCIIFIPLFALWANMHASFIAGFTILGAYFLQYVRSKDYDSAKRYVMLGLLCAFATLCNPYTWEIYLLVYNTFKHPVTAQISEWQPIRFFTQDGITMHLIVFILVAITAAPSKKASFGEKLMMIAWFIMAIKSARNYMVFALLSAPVFALMMDGLKKDPKELLLKLGDKTEYKRRAVTFTIALMIAVGISITWLLPRTDITEGKSNLDREVKFIAERYSNKKFFCS